MGQSNPGDATLLLRRWAEGDRAAEGRLYELLYVELQRLARGHIRGRRGSSLQPTALINDAWIRLVGLEKLELSDSDHFLAVASRAMRCIIIDHARRRAAKKRGGVFERVPLDLVVDEHEKRSTDLVALGEALQKLDTEDWQLAQVVELRFFGGLSMAEVARYRGVSLTTVERSWRLARIWLRAELAP